MNDKTIEDKITDLFVKEWKNNGMNGSWAIDTVDYKVFVENYDKFISLSEDEQWRVRHIINALRKIYG